MTSPKIAIAQLGARKHYQEPILLHQWGMLDTLFTDFYAGNSLPFHLLRRTKLSRYLPNSAKRGLDRFDPALNNANIIHFPWLGCKYALTLQRVKPQDSVRTFVEIGQLFCQRIINYGLGEADTIYGFNGACLELFEYAKSRGIRCILDQTLAERSYLHQLLSEEAIQWSDCLLKPFKVTKADEELAWRERQEQDFADQIICGSDFVKDSLIRRGIDANKVSVVPLGQATSYGSSFPIRPKSSWKEREGGLRILFAGTVGLRKGVPYLLKALRKIQGEFPFTCKIAGTVELCSEWLQEYTDVCDFLGRISRSEMSTLYNWADVFVLPSICEGSAMVTYEALQSGLPIITTYNAGSIVESASGNWILPIRDSQAIAKALDDMFHKGMHNFPFITCQKNCLEKAREQALNRLKHVILGLDHNVSFHKSGL